MARRMTGGCVLVGVVWCLAGALLAHHSFGAEYDAAKPITLSGVITAVEWTNPHSHFYLDVTDDKGTVTNWKFEGYNPAVLSRIGWHISAPANGSRTAVFPVAHRPSNVGSHNRQRSPRNCSQGTTFLHLSTRSAAFPERTAALHRSMLRKESRRI